MIHENVGEMPVDLSSNKQADEFNLKLSGLFSDPQASRSNAIVVSNGACQDEGIEVGSLVKIDFTINSIKHDGLYVITLDDEWIGYRRFQFMPDLKVITGDVITTVTPNIMRSIKVVGLVKDIYRSTQQH
jgi:hypothetical protein